MLWLLPVEGVSLPIAIACGGLVLIFSVSDATNIYSGLENFAGAIANTLKSKFLGGYVLVVIALFLGITYILSADLSIASRYHFVYFPALSL